MVWVGDDVDQRIELSDRPGDGSSQEHFEQGVEAALGGTAVQQSRVHPLTPSGDTGIPVGAELEVAEPFEDLLDHRPGGDTTASIEIDVLINDTDMSVETAVGAFMSPMSAINISEGFPAAHDDGELVEPQLGGVIDQQPRRCGELCSTARVGEHLGQQPRLGDTQLAGVRRSANLRRRGHQP